MKYGNEKILQGSMICGGSAKGNKLADLFAREIHNDRVAWYIDYYTEEASKYGVRHLLDDKENSIFMTNEQKEHRNPNDPETIWTPAQVAEWFEREDIYHAWSFIFRHKGNGELFGIHFEMFLVFAFGSRAASLAEGNLWTRYTEDGVLAPMKDCGDPASYDLEAIIFDPKIETIKNYGLFQEFVLGMSAAID